VEQTASGKRRVDHRGNWRPKVACLVFFRDTASVLVYQIQTADPMRASLVGL